MELLDTFEFEKAIKIREVENRLLKYFANGTINGTVHTCVGQEFSGLAFAGQLGNTDFVISNHRGHGHFISFTGEYDSLIAELMGKSIGICAGIGSSQHLYKKNFLTNGIQGGIVPVAAGIAMAEKLKRSNNIAVVFIGDGTLGEGVLYETLNIISLWKIPLLVVCENNKYAQSTSQKFNLAGDILKRAEAFNIETKQSDIWNLKELYSDARSSIESVRDKCKPIFHLVDVYRLNAHSKGDDLRDQNEINYYRTLDPVNLFQENTNGKYSGIKEKVENELALIENEIKAYSEQEPEKYFTFSNNSKLQYDWCSQIMELDGCRVSDRINTFFIDKMNEDEKIILIGEDIGDPYGGTFKVTKGISDKYEGRVFNSPLSEAAITGIGNGLALNGYRPVIEIMFGDFITLAFDQIVNHASKFFHMYNFQINDPIIIRTPMGAWRGYGPTHSQSLERFLIGIDNIKVFCIDTFIDPYKIYEQILNEKHPVIVLEYKAEYGIKLKRADILGYKVENSFGNYPLSRIRPVSLNPSLTIVTYGYMATYVSEFLHEIIDQTELVPEVIILSCINPIHLGYIRESLEETGRLLVVEEGNETGGVGAQILLQLHNEDKSDFDARVVGALPVPIPAAKSLENYVLPNKNRLMKAIGEMIK